MSVTVQNREELEKKVANAKHMSKPDADNAVVVRDPDGRCLFEIYTVGHTVEGLEQPPTVRRRKSS